MQSLKSALDKFERENNVKSILFQHSKEEQREIVKSAPWKQDPKYFKKVYISITALIKLVMHAKSGGDIEVMGSLQGRVNGNSLVIVDSFALPVEGTETRVSAQNEGYEYMVKYMTLAEQVQRLENVVGWYHSHPGYGCWLSGIDVSTQTLNQTYSEPFCALVIDPHRTISSGKVEIGAFRTYPADYVPPDSETESKSIPLAKIKDYGVHAKKYYQLEIEYFKSPLDEYLLDVLWEKYWINTLSSSSLHSQWDLLSFSINDLAEKIKLKGESNSTGDYSREEGVNADKIAQESHRIAEEATNGMISLELKKMVFDSTILK